MNVIPLFVSLATITWVGSPQSVSTPNRPTEFVKLNQAMDRIHANLETIRFEMGMPQPTPPVFKVRNPSLRQIYFQALTVLEKANRLCFDLTPETVSAPGSSAGNVTPGEVHGALLAIEGRLWRVIDAGNMSEPQNLSSATNPATLNDLFESLALANRQLNIELDKRFTPSDVFQQVTTAVGYASCIRSKYPGIRIPRTPAFERGKLPSDVLRRLAKSLEFLASVKSAVGAEPVVIDLVDSHHNFIKPSDVYDLASILVAELEWLDIHLGCQHHISHAYPAGYKFPSHVYQRAGLLQAQLLELRTLVGSESGVLGSINKD